MAALKDQMEALLEVIFVESFHGHTLQPKLGESTEFKYRNAEIDLRICETCHEQYGTIYPAEEAPTTLQIKEHLLCRCTIEWLKSILAGTATVNGLNGADFVVKHTGSLPDTYMHKDEARQKGWKQKKGNLAEVLPGISLYEEHENRNGKLPAAPNRKWYEADINYHGGPRNSQRLLFSNDGLIFVSYDHYQTYFQIV